MTTHGYNLSCSFIKVSVRADCQFERLSPMAEVAACAHPVTLTRAFQSGRRFQQRNGIQAKCLEGEMVGGGQVVSVADSGKPATEPCQLIRREPQALVKQACSYPSIEKQHFSSKPRPNPNTLTEPTSHRSHSFREQKGPSTGCWSPVFHMHWSSFGREERCFREVEPQSLNGK